jgi:hypothetical protein
MISPSYNQESGIIAEQKTVASFLWDHVENEQCYLYAIVDSARNEEVFRHFLTGNVIYRSLYEGTMDEQSWRVSGFLVDCNKDSTLFQWITTNAWGESGCIFFTSHASFNTIFKHFQKFNRVYLENDEVVFFRYYDPRVLRIYLPTCTRNEIETFFGEIKNFFIESENQGEIRVFRKEEYHGSSMNIAIANYKLEIISTA